MSNVEKLSKVIKRNSPYYKRSTLDLRPQILNSHVCTFARSHVYTFMREAVPLYNAAKLEFLL